MKKIITHSGSFHLDDLFAIATLKILYPDLKITRSRDLKDIEDSDFIVDVGDVYDEEKNKFDHHQRGGAGVRENGVPYASFGLVWKKFGEEVCGGDERVADLVDKKMVQPIDAADNGYNMYKETKKGLSPYLLDNAFKALTPTWRDEESVDETFEKLLPLAQEILKREIKKAQYFFEDTELVKQSYKDAEDKRIIVLEHPMAWKSVISRKKEPLYLIHPNQITGEWIVACVRKTPRSHENRKLLPQKWGGKRGEELERITGVKDVESCHNKRFIATAWTREAAIKLAKLAVENKE
jgi:uncharacterized UPF0160 family protein